MKKLIYLIVVIVALGLIVAGCLPSVVPPSEQDELGSRTNGGTTWNVDDDWQIGTPPYAEDTDGDSDFATIQAAITAASDYDTIIVAPGTYTDDIWDSSLGIPAGYRITKSVTLLGAQAGSDPAGSTDRGGETILVRTNGLPYSLFVSGITIDGFMNGDATANSGGRFIIGDAADDVTIKNCIIQNTPTTSSGHGVYIYPGAQNALIEYNTFYNTGWEAIASWQASGAVISHNYISSSGQHAIQMMGHAGSNNEITYNHISGITGKNAIQYWGGPGATISYNVIVGGNTMYDGIWLDAAADNSTVSYNQISDTIYAGINVRPTCTGAIVTYNDVTGCGTGIVTYGGEATISHNVINGGNDGIWLDNEADDSTVSHNQISDTGFAGINIREMCINVVVTYNDISGCGTGVEKHVGDITGVSVNYNNIAGNSWGIRNYDTGLLDAEYNWWGDISGPIHTTNPSGIGDSVSNNVDYDPWIGQEGMITGGGWIMSPAGAYLANPELEGKATFGFVSMYKKGADVPTGKTQFNFQVADLNFHSDSYDWLRVAGAKAMYKGTGTINGEGGYGFMLSAIDEKLTPSTDVDMFRIKIWDKGTDTIIYDNGCEGPEGTEIGGGQIVIHKGK